MDRSEVLSRVRERAVALLGVAPGELSEATRFAEDLGLDSLALVEWTLGLEEAFDVELPEEHVTEVTTVGALVDLVAGQLLPGGPPREVDGPGISTAPRTTSSPRARP